MLNRVENRVNFTYFTLSAYTVDVAYINTMKTTFDFNFSLYFKLLNSMDTNKHRRQEKLSIKKAYLWLIINLYFQVKFVRNQNFKKTSSSLYWYNRLPLYMLTVIQIMLEIINVIFNFQTIFNQLVTFCKQHLLLHISYF